MNVLMHLLEEIAKRINSLLDKRDDPYRIPVTIALQ